MSKRKHVSIPLHLKLEALKRLDAGETIKRVSTELGVSKVTVGDWKRNRKKLEEWNSGQKNCLRTRMRKSEYEKTNEALLLWFFTQRKNGNLVTGPDLQQKAKYFQREFQEGEKCFTASDGWLDRWKKRYGIKLSENPDILDDALDIKLEERINRCDTMSDPEILNDALEIKLEEYSDGVMLENELPISHDEGLAALTKALNYIQQQQEVNLADILCIKKWCNITSKKVCES